MLLTPSNTLDSSSHLDQNMGMQQQSMLDPTSTPITPFPPNSGGMPNLSQTPFSPPYAFSSLQQPESYDPMFGMGQMGFYPSNSTPNNGMSSSLGNGMGSNNGLGGSNGMGMGVQEGMTPGARSDGQSTEGEKDPFLSLLEQLAENEHSRGGPSELDFFLSGGNG